MPHNLWRRLVALIPKLPQLFQRTRELEDRVGKLEHQDEKEQVR
jgi:hypothetical protein